MIEPKIIVKRKEYKIEQKILDEPKNSGPKIIMNKNLDEPKIIVNQKYRRTENNNKPKRNQILKIIMIEKKETKNKNK